MNTSNKNISRQAQTDSLASAQTGANLTSNSLNLKPSKNIHTKGSKKTGALPLKTPAENSAAPADESQQELVSKSIESSANDVALNAPDVQVSSTAPSSAEQSPTTGSGEPIAQASSAVTSSTVLSTLLSFEAAPLIAAIPLALMLSGSSSGNDNSASVSQTATITGAVVAGPVISQNDLRLIAYRLDTGARVSDQPVQLNADGTFTMTISGFTGPAVFVLSSENDDTPDYLDEALGVAVNLTDALAAVAVITIGTQSLNVTPLSTIAALDLRVDLLGLTPSDTQLTQQGSQSWTAAISSTEVTQAITKVINAFGLTEAEYNGTIVPSVEVVTQQGDSEPIAIPRVSNTYGLVLAALSGADALDSVSVTSGLMALADSIQTVTIGNTTQYTLSTAGQAALLRGAEAAAQISGVSKSDIVRLIDPQAEQAANSITQFDANTLSSLSPTVAAMLSVQQIAGLDRAQLMSLSPEALSAVSAPAITAWQQNSGLNLISELMTDVALAPRVSLLTQSQLVAAMPQQLNAEVVLALSPSAIRAIDPGVIAQMSTAAIVDLAPAQIRSLSNDQVQAFTTPQLQALDPSQLTLMQARQVSAMTPTQFSALDVAQMTALANSGAFRTLTPELVAEVHPEVFGSIPVTRLINLTSSQIQNLSVPQLAGMSAQQIEMLTSVDVAGNSSVTPFLDVVTDAIGQLNQPVNSWQALGDVITPVVDAIIAVTAINAGQNASISADDLTALGFTSSLSGNQLASNLQLAQAALARADDIVDVATLNNTMLAVGHLYDLVYGQNSAALSLSDCEILGIASTQNTLTQSRELITELVSNLAPADGAEYAQVFVAATEINNLAQATQPQPSNLLSANAAVTLGFGTSIQNVNASQAQNLVLELWQQNPPATPADRLDLVTAAADFYQFAYSGENAPQLELATLQAFGYDNATANNLSAYSSYLEDAIATLDLADPADLLDGVGTVDRLYAFISSQGAQDTLTTQDLLTLGFATGTPNSTEIQTIKATITSEVVGGDLLVSEIRQAFGDVTPPTINVTASRSSLNAGQTSTITFTLSEASTDFTQSDVTVSGGALSNWTASSSTVYTADFTPSANSTTNGVIAVASNRFSDAAGNLNADGSDTNNTITLTVDSVLPTVAVSSSATSLTTGQTANITFTLSEASTDFTQSDITVSGGALSNWTASSSTVYTAVFTPTANSTTNGVIAVANNRFSDAAGNFNADGSDANNTATLSVNTNSAPSSSSSPAVTAWLNSFRQIYAGKSATDAYVALMQSDLLLPNELSIFNANLTSTPYAYKSAIATAVRVAVGGLQVPPNTPTISVNNPTEQEIAAVLAGRLTTINTSLNSFATTVGTMTTQSAGSSLGTLIQNLTGDTYIATLANPNSQTGMQGNTPTYALPYVSGNGRAYLTALQASGWASNAAAPTLSEIQAVITAENNRFFNLVMTELREDAAGNANLALVSSPLLTGFYSALRPGASLSNITTPLRTYINTNISGQTTVNDVANLIDTYKTQAAESYADLVEQAIATSNASLISNYFTSSTTLSDFFSGASSWSMAGSGSGLWARTTTALMDTQNYANAQNISVSEITGILNTLSNDFSSASNTFNTAYSTSNYSGLTTSQWQVLLNNVNSSNIGAYTSALQATKASQYGNFYNYNFAFIQLVIDRVNAGTYTGPFDPFNVNNPQQPQQPQQPSDNTPPTIAITSDNPSVERGETATITFTLSEASTNFVSSDVTVDSRYGALSNFTGSGTTYTATFTPLSDVANLYNQISVDYNKFSDAAGNSNQQNTYLSLPVDTYPPFTATITAGPTARSVYVTFSEAVSSYHPSDQYFQISGATYEWGSSSRDSQYQGPGTRWIVGVWPIQGASGTVTVEFDQSSPPYRSRDYSPLSTFPSAYSFVMDATPPTLSVTSSRQTIEDTNQTSTFTFTFSEAVTGFDITDLILGYSTQYSTNWNDQNNQIPDVSGNNYLSFTNNDFLSNFTAVSSTVYTVDLSAPANLANTVKIKLKDSHHQIQDAAGNAYAHNGSYPAATLAEVAVDTDTRARDLVRAVQAGTQSPSAWDYSNEGISIGQGTEQFLNEVLPTLAQVQTNAQAKLVAVGLYRLYMHAIGHAAYQQIPEPTVAQLAAIGLTGVDSEQKVSLLISVIDQLANPAMQQHSAINSLTELQSFADIVNDSTPPVITYSSLNLERFSNTNLTPTLNERTSELYLLPTSYQVASRSDLDGNAIATYRMQNQGFEYQSWINQLAGQLTLNNIDGLPVGEYKLYAVDMAGNYSVSNATISITATPANVVVTPGTFSNTGTVNFSSTGTGQAYLTESTVNNLDSTYVWNDNRIKQTINVGQSGNVSFNLSWLNSGTYRLWFKTASGAWSSDSSHLITVDATAPDISLQSTQGIGSYNSLYATVAPNHVLSVKLDEVGTIKLFDPGTPSNAVEVQYTASDLAANAYKSISFAGLPTGSSSYNHPNYILQATDAYGNQTNATASDGLSEHGIIIDAFAEAPNMAVSGSTVTVTGVNDVLSGETAYLIKTGETMATVADIQALVLAGKAIQVSSYTAATQWADGSGSFVTTGLVEGTYRGYTVDTFGNISSAATNSQNYQIQEFYKDLTGPVISYSQFTFTRNISQYFDITSNEAGYFYIVPTSVAVTNLQSILDNDINSSLSFSHGGGYNTAITAGQNHHYIYNGGSATPGDYYVYAVDSSGNYSSTPTAIFQII